MSDAPQNEPGDELPPSIGEFTRDDRVSIWEVRRGWRDRFWVVFIGQLLAAAAFESWFHLHYGVGETGWHAARDIISNTTPYVVLIGPSSYLVTEVSVMLSERYLAWRRKKSRKALSGWLNRRKRACLRGDDFEEPIPDEVDWHTIETYIDYILDDPYVRKSDSNGHQRSEADYDERERLILEKEAWFGRKYLAEQNGGTFNEPYPNGNGTPSQ